MNAHTFAVARMRKSVRFRDGGLVVLCNARNVFGVDRCLGETRWLWLPVALALLCAATCGEVVSQDNPQASQSQQPASADQSSSPAVKPPGSTDKESGSTDKESGSADKAPDQSSQTPSPSVGDSKSAESVEDGGDPKSPNELTLSEVEKEWASIDSSSSVDDAVKETLRPLYRQTIEKLKQAEANKKLEEDYRKAVVSAPQETKDLQRELSELPTLEEAAETDMQLDVQELQKVVAQRQDKLVALRNDLSNASSDLTRILSRRDDITIRTAKLKTELGQLRAKLASPDLAEDASSPRRVADRLLVNAQQISLVAEDQMLKAELESQDKREQLATVKQELLNQQEKNSEALVARLQARWSESKSKESYELTAKITAVLREAKSQSTSGTEKPTSGTEELDDLIKDVEALLTEYTDSVDLSKRVSAAQTAASQRLNYLEQEYSHLQTQIEMQGGGRALAQVLFDLQDQLLNPAKSTVDSTADLPKLDDLRIRNLRVERDIRNHETMVNTTSVDSAKFAQPLLDARFELLKKLNQEYSDLIPTLSALSVANELFLERVDEVRDFISEQLFWIRSGMPVSISSIGEIPEGVFWLFNADHWQEFATAIFHLFVTMPVRCLLLFLTVIGLCIGRPWIIAALNRTGLMTKRVSSDRYWLTWQALGLTVMLALPIPIVLFFLAWATQQATEQSVWLRGIESGLRSAVWVTLILAFVGAASRPGGLGIMHFGGRFATLRLLRKTVFRIGVVYVPAQVLAASTLYGDASQYSGSVGRFLFILAHVWAMLLVIRMFKSSEGLVTASAERYPDSALAKLQYLLFAVTVSVPASLVVLAWQGYLITAIELSLNFVATLTVMSVGELSYWMALRWFALKRRQLAVAERLEQWRTRKAAEESAEQEVEGIVSEPDLDQELDLEAISEQTRRLLQFLFTVGTVIAIFGLWSGTIPLISVLEAVQIFGGLSLLDLVQSMVIIAVTTIAVKNLPGVLELAALRTTTIEPGTRYAIVTLCRYTLMAVGFAAVAKVLDIDWSKYAWIAAALSVGLGFGLQEVVTNFVCGIILLFERPVRVGDVVTVDGTTGTVTRIRMRATTITNWDRQELVVPNKNLITNTFLNWTLTATISRIVINVGAAYGSDTDFARDILVSVANDHPSIMEEPKPMATFEQFADSSLNLCLRAYVPDLDSRLRTITELHTEIDRRFAKAGIEIAFPQQDINLRNAVICPKCRADTAINPSDDA